VGNQHRRGKDEMWIIQADHILANYEKLGWVKSTMASKKVFYVGHCPDNDQSLQRLRNTINTTSMYKDMQH
jgi:hypothetical protein